MPRVRSWAARLTTRLGIAALSVLIAVVALIVAGLLVQSSGSAAAHAKSRGHDALWMGHAWVDGRRTTGDVEVLAQQLYGTGIRDLYVHVGPLENDGSLSSAKRPAAKRFVSDVRRTMPSVRVQAWLGNVVGRYDLDLTDPGNRARVVEAARSVLAEGFDGVHYDLEPIHSGDRFFLELLTVTRALTREHDAVLSVAANDAEGIAGVNRVVQYFIGRPAYWTVDYLREVALRVDQVAIMSYDTAIPIERLYVGYVARQTRLALRAVPWDVDLLMGAPAFHDNNIGHHAGAETVAAAVGGVRLALTEHPHRQRVGIALYVDFAATDADWRAYRTDWLNPRPHEFGPAT